MATILLLLLTVLLRGSLADIGCYNVDQGKISVSGYSSGGFFAVQFHVAYSKSIMGSGIIAGGPYYCAQGNLANSLSLCKSFSKLNVGRYVQQVNTYRALNKIDDPNELKNDRVYLYSGAKDTVVDPSVVKALERFYSHFVNPTNIYSVYSIESQNSMVTDDYGNSCSTLGSPFINNCNYPTAFNILRHIYGVDIKPASHKNAITANLFKFHQSEYFETPMDNIGYIYIPTGCQGNSNSSTTKCKLHIVFHGSSQGREYIDTQFALNAGYNGVAEVNNIIIVYPQVHRQDIYNPKGSWDWWGYTSEDYANKYGPQMSGVMKILTKLTCN